MTLYTSYMQLNNTSITFWDMRKLDFPSKLEYILEKNYGGHQNSKVAKNNDFKCLGYFFCASE